MSGNAICWEANIITFNNSNVLASVNTANINTGFQHGWLQIGFFPPTVTGIVHTLANTATSIVNASTGGISSGQTVTYFGLPLIGFEVEDYVNGVNTLGVLSNFGGNFVHKTTTCINC